MDAYDVRKIVSIQKHELEILKPQNHVFPVIFIFI